MHDAPPRSASICPATLGTGMIENPAVQARCTMRALLASVSPFRRPKPTAAACQIRCRSSALASPSPCHSSATATASSALCPIKLTMEQAACRQSAWRPNPGRRSTYRSGKTVRTSGATSSGPIGIETFGPSLSSDPQAKAWWAGLLRSASSPGALKAVLDALRDVDVRPHLPQVLVRSSCSRTESFP